MNEQESPTLADRIVARWDAEDAAMAAGHSMLGFAESCPAKYMPLRFKEGRYLGMQMDRLANQIGALSPLTEPITRG